MSCCSEEYGLETAAFQIISGGVVPMDLATVQLPDGSSSYMAIMTSWGIVADVDIESEKFRKIGKTRFLIGECGQYTLLCQFNTSYIFPQIALFHCVLS